MPQELYQELLERLSRLRRARERVAVGIGASRAASIIIASILVALLIEATFHLSITGRTILFFTTIALSLASLGLLAFPAAAEMLGFKKRLSDEALASKIGEHFTEVEDRLVNVLQLASNSRESVFGSPSFASAAFAGTYQSIRHIDFNKIIDERPMRRAFILFFLTIATTLGSFLIGGSDLAAAGGRMIHFRTFYQKPAPFQFALRPGNSKVLRGESVKIVVRTNGEQLRNATLQYREGSAGEFESIELKAHPLDSSVTKAGGILTEFVYEIHPQHSTEYYVETREIESEHFTITVLDRPVVKLLSVSLAPPSYTHQPVQKLADNFGDITTLIGTRAEFTVTSSKPLLNAELIFRPLKSADTLGTRSTSADSLSTYHLSVSGQTARGSIQLKHSGSYHLLLLDADSILSEHPIEYSVALTIDEAPAIALIEPGERAEIPSVMRVPMLAKIHDDFGFSSVRLGYRLRSSKYLPEEKEYKWIALPLSAYTVQDLEVPYVWNLTPLDLSPEDEVGYVLEVADNNTVTGPTRVRTSEFSLRFPSVEEIFKRAEEQSNNADRSLHEIKQDADELKKKVDEVMNEMKQTPTSEIAKKQQEFSHQKDVQEVLKRQEELNNRVADVKKNIEQMTDKLAQQNALTPETMEKYMELQKLFEQINSPELKEAMKKLQDAMKSVDQKAIQQAMKNFQLNDEQFRKSLERTANILKKIQMEQKVDQLMKRSDELAKDQEKAAAHQDELSKNSQDQTREQQSMDERKQKDAANELERMKQEAKDLARDMKKLPEPMQAPDEMKEAQEALADPTMEKSMQDAQDAMQKKDHQRAAQRNKDAAQKAKTARNKLAQLKKKLAQNEKQKTLAELRAIRDEMNRLSKAEEQLKNKSAAAQPQSTVFRDFADEQADRKEELGNVASQLFQLAQKSPAVTPEMGKSLGEAFNNMQQAMNAMTERDQTGSTVNSRGAMAALNTVSKQTQAAMDAMQQGSSCPNGDGDNPGGMKPGDETGDGQPGGSAMQQFLNQINKLTAQQQGLNDQMQQMMNGQQQGGAQSAELQAQQRQAQLSKLAGEQSAVKKSIEDLAKEQKESQGGNRKAVDDLRKIADEMQDVISDMKSRGVRPETVQRQERILSRLLEAQRSIHERDKDQSREAKSAEDVTRQSPPDLDPNTEDARRALREDMLRANESAYSKDYQALIRKYLERLGK